MKKMIIALLLIAGVTFAANVNKVVVKAAALSTAVTNTVTFTASDNRVTTPVLFVNTTTQTNTPIVTVNPIKSGAPTYTVYTSTAKTNVTTTVVMNDKSSSTSPKVIMLPGDIMTITGSAESWATAGYYVIIEETDQ